MASARIHQGHAGHRVSPTRTATYVVSAVAFSCYVKVILFEAWKNLEKCFQEQKIVCRGLLIICAVVCLVRGPGQPDAGGLLDVQDAGLLVPAVFVQLDGSAVVGKAKGSMLSPEAVRN